MHKNLFVFDIETIPDLNSAKNLLGQDEKNLHEALVEYHLKITDGKNAFIRQLFHQVVCISFLQAEIHHNNNGEEYYVLTDIRSGGTEESSEEDLIHGCFKHLSSIKPRFVSFNGRMFDLPVLKYRAMLYEIQAKWFYSSGDKWNNYSSKFSNNWHCDLIDALSDYGTSAKVKMNEVCALFNLPGKIQVDGSQVFDMYKEGKISEIRDYCELDVINTYLIYLKYQLHTGVLSKDSYHVCIGDLESYLQEVDKANFNLFLDEWKRS